MWPLGLGVHLRSVLDLEGNVLRVGRVALGHEEFVSLAHIDVVIMERGGLGLELLNFTLE